MIHIINNTKDLIKNKNKNNIYYEYEFKMINTEFTKENLKELLNKK